MKNIFPLLFIIALFTSCKRELKTDYKNLWNAEFEGLSVPLPGIFVETDLDRLAGAWSQSAAPNNVIERQLQRIESMRLAGNAFAIYVDTTEISNTVTVFSGPYIKINKWTSQQLFKTLDKRLRLDAKDIAWSFKPLENNYYTLKNGNDLLKVKFEYYNDSLKSYGTQYLLNIRGSTYGISVSNNEEDDFEGLVRKAKVVTF